MPAQVSTTGTRQLIRWMPPSRCTTAYSGASHSRHMAIKVASMASVAYGPEAHAAPWAARSPSTWAGRPPPSPGTRVTVLTAEVEPERLWQRLLQSQRGAVVAHAVRRDTDAVICRLRLRVS